MSPAVRFHSRDPSQTPPTLQRAFLSLNCPASDTNGIPRLDNTDVFFMRYYFPTSRAFCPNIRCITSTTSLGASNIPMSSLIPFISDLLPMVLPASTSVIPASSLEPPEPTAEGPVIIRRAVVNKSDKMCASVLTIRPKSAMHVHHNSEQDAILYTVSGHATLTTKEGFQADTKRFDLAPGDFAFVPAWAEHRISNETEADTVLTITQSGSHPVGADLAGWGGEEITTRS